MPRKKPQQSRRPDDDDEFHMADTAEFETLNEADTDVLETLSEESNPEKSDDDLGFDPYNNTRPRSKSARANGG